MALAVFYTEAAKSTLTSVYAFINSKFGKRVAEQFIVKAERTISLIAEHPLIFKASVFDETVRVGLIIPRCSLFYRVTDTQVQLLFFWDNRQEPISYL